MRLITTNF